MSKFFAQHRTMAKAIITVSTAVALSGLSLVSVAQAAGLTDAQIQSILSLLQSFGADQATINNVSSALHGQATTGTGGTTTAGACSFTRNLTIGVKGDDVTCLQNYLTSTGHFTYSGGATGYFGSITKAAVAAWQSANGVSPAAGYFGPISVAKYNSLAGTTGGTTTTGGTGGTTTTPVAGDALGVAKPTQPGDNLAPGGAARLPVTNFTLTAGTRDVTVNSVTVERVGLATDAAVSSVVLIGPDGLQIGLQKTLASNHRSILDTSFVVKAGTTGTYTIAFNRPTTANEAGNVLTFDVVAVDASSPLSGTLPIRGSQITMNATLTIGSVSLTRGVNDPGTSATSSPKSIGDTGYKFSALRLTAGSAEDLLVKSISWNETGSVGSSDLANVKIFLRGSDLNDTEYPVIVSSDGKYYTAKFGDGVTIAKGNSAEVYIKGDIAGGTNRTIEFDLYRFTDLNVVGKQYGFGVTPTGGTATAGSTANGALSSDANPAFKGYVVQVGAGTMTVSKSTDPLAAAQNIAVNLNDQILGAFDVDVKGEPIEVASMVFRLDKNVHDANVTGVDYSGVALYSSAGAVVAGPKDGAGTTVDNGATLTFTDTVDFPVGKHTYFLKGKLSTDFTNNTQVSASTTPSTDWTSATGKVSGQTITPANVGTVTGNSMTVKTAALSVSLSNSPTSQTVIRGTTGFTFANIVFDATASGEDIRLTSAQVQLFGASGNEVKNCALWDGTTQLNTGSNVINPTGEGDQTFTFDNGVVVSKGTAKTLALKCDTLASGTSGHAMWSFSNNETFGATGMVSGNTLTVSVASSSVTNNMTLSSSGSLTVALDSSSPAVKLAQAGQEVTVAALRFDATSEDMDVKQIALQFSNTASNTPADVTQLNLYDGATRVGTISATSSDTGLITSVSGFIVPKDGSKVMTVKAVLSPIGVSQAGKSGHLVTINYDNVNLDTNSPTYAIGLGSSQIIRVTSADTASAGVRVVRAYPTISVLAVPTSTISNAEMTLYRFSVSAPAGTNGISLYKFTFNVATIAATITKIDQLKLYAYSDSAFSQALYSSDGQLNNGGFYCGTEGSPSGVCEYNAGGTDQDATAGAGDRTFYFNPVTGSGSTQEAIAISAGQTVYFALKGTPSGVGAGDSFSIQLYGDGTWPKARDTADNFNVSGSVNYAFATSAVYVDASNGTVGSMSDDDMIWSDNATTTVGVANGDWFNGFLVPGLPSGGGSSIGFSL